MSGLNKRVTATVFTLSILAVSASQSEGQAAKRSKARQPVQSSPVLVRPMAISQQEAIDDAPEMKVAKPGTPEAKRLADLRAKVNAGLVPVFHLGGDLDQLRIPQSPPPNVGTRIIPNPEAKGEMLRLQSEFAELFSRQDPQPNSRAAHFAWIPKYDHVFQIGWRGSIAEAEVQADGSIFVSVKVHPYLYSQYMKTLVLDYVTEVYRVTDGRIELIASDAAIPKLHLQAFPIH